MKQKKLLLIFILTLLPFCLYAAGLKEAYNCGQAAEMLQINADAYHNPAPTVEDILAGVSPYMPLTRMEGCKMLLRAFGPLPDVQEGVRYLVKYRDCAFTDVPEEGREAVENLTNAGLYIPEDNTKFGPNQLMTESELAVLVDRIHAYLQSSLKDDYYSWATADVVNNPDFFPWDYDYSYFSLNSYDIDAHISWIINMFNDCLDNPDTPEKKNIAALLSTYMDTEERENSMTYIQPMIDAIWNAADFYELMDVLADIRRETGIELFLGRNNWSYFSTAYGIDYDTDKVYDANEFGLLSIITSPEQLIPGNFFYDNVLTQRTRLLSCLGIDKEDARASVRNYLDGLISEAYSLYSNSPYDEFDYWSFAVDNIPEELSFLPLTRYIERAGYGTDYIYILNRYECLSILETASLEKNLAGIKCDCICKFIISLDQIVPPTIKDVIYEFQEDYYAADPGNYLSSDLDQMVLLGMIQDDVNRYYSKTEEYIQWYEKLETLCNEIKAYYHQMLEKATWLSDYARQQALNKLDDMGVELLIPQDISKTLHVEYVSAADGGTLFENTIRYLKTRYNFISQSKFSDGPVFIWSHHNGWATSQFYAKEMNTFFLCMSDFISSHFMKDQCYETLMAYIGSSIAHEISHGFDYFSMLYDNMLTPEDIEEFNARCAFMADYISGYEFFPGLAVEDGYQILNEFTADFAGMKCLLSIASETPGFDYDKFFRAYADSYATSATRKAVINTLLHDDHPSGRARVNLILPLIDEFYTTYDIKEGDAMYVAPEDRPYIW